MINLRLLSMLSLLLVATFAIAQSKPTIFVSIPPQAWLVDQLAGSLVQSETLLTPGANPHIFEPTPRQIRSLSTSTLYLTIGFTFEEAIVSRSARINRNLKTASMGTGIDRLHGHDHHHDDDHDHATCQGSDGDPHYWLSPRHYATMASNTVAAIKPLLATPQQQQQLDDNLAALTKRIATLDQQIRQNLKELPTRTWLVYHPSWSYFAADYNLKLLVIESDGKAPGARHLAEIIRQAKPLGITTIYTEPQYDPKPAHALAIQLNAQVKLLNPLQYEWLELMQQVTESLSGTPLPLLPEKEAP